MCSFLIERTGLSHILLIFYPLREFSFLITPLPPHFEQTLEPSGPLGNLPFSVFAKEI